MSKKIKISYVIPTYRREVTLDTMMTFYRDVRWVHSQDKYEVIPKGKEGIGVHLHRNSAVKEAYEEGCRYLFMMDADVYANGSPLRTLLGTLKRHKAVAAGGVVVCRTGKLNCRAIKPGGVMKGWVGTGIIVIDVKKLVENVPPPWFKFRDNEDGTGMARGEDFHFCERCEAAGLTVIVDGTLPTGHRGERAWLYHPDHGIIDDSVRNKNKNKAEKRIM